MKIVKITIYNELSNKPDKFNIRLKINKQTKYIDHKLNTIEYILIHERS